MAEAYAAFKSRSLEPEAAIEALQELVLAQPPLPDGSAAACVALVKACTLHAAHVLQNRKPPDEAAAAVLLTQAAEAAVRGALVYKSAQLLVRVERQRSGPGCCSGCCAACCGARWSGRRSREGAACRRGSACACRWPPCR